MNKKQAFPVLNPNKNGLLPGITTQYRYRLRLFDR